MDHVVILAARLGMLDKIISGEKTIESRWSMDKRAPFERVQKGEWLYLKTSGQPVSYRTRVQRVEYYQNLNEERVAQLVRTYGKEICLTEQYTATLKKKKYCTLVWMEKVEKIEPFQVNKKGFGNMCAWLMVEDVGKIRLE